MRKLKVFATTSGIHDHVVAAPSRPAALKAWGAKTDLFSMGVAKQVTDPKLVKQALARPGEVFSVGRSGEVEISRPRGRQAASKKPAPRPPSSVKVHAAEQRLEELDKKQAEESVKVEQQLAALTRKQEQLAKRHAKARRAAEAKVDEARDAYKAMLDDWSG